MASTTATSTTSTSTTSTYTSPTTGQGEAAGAAAGAKIGRACDVACATASELGRTASVHAAEFKTVAGEAMTDVSQGLKQMGHDIKDGTAWTWTKEAAAEGAVAAKDMAIEGAQVAGNKMNQLAWQATAAYEKAAVKHAAKHGDLEGAAQHEAKMVRAEVQVAKTKFTNPYPEPAPQPAPISTAFITPTPAAPTGGLKHEMTAAIDAATADTHVAVQDASSLLHPPSLSTMEPTAAKPRPRPGSDHSAMAADLSLAPTTSLRTDMTAAITGATADTDVAAATALSRPHLSTMEPVAAPPHTAPTAST